MFDAKAEYNRINNLKADLMENPKENAALIDIYQSVLNVISNDYRYRTKTHIELSQVPE